MKPDYEGDRYSGILQTRFSLAEKCCPRRDISGASWTGYTARRREECGYHEGCKRGTRKLKKVQKRIKEAEERLLELLPSYTTNTNLESVVERQEYDLVLDSGAMVPSGDADHETGEAADRRPVDHTLAVKGVHGQAKPVKSSSR